MRWFVYFIFAYLALGLQIGLSPYIRYHGAAPNLPLLAVVFIALNAPRDAALLGAFGIGLIQDLLSAQPPGLYALSYGLVAMLVAGASQATYREHPLTHFALALIGGLIAMAVLMLHGWLRPPTSTFGEAKANLPAVHLPAGLLFTGVIYTAILSPILIGGLQRLRGVFAFRTPRRRTRI